MLRFHQHRTIEQWSGRRRHPLLKHMHVPNLCILWCVALQVCNYYCCSTVVKSFGWHTVLWGSCLEVFSSTLWVKQTTKREVNPPGVSWRWSQHFCLILYGFHISMHRHVIMSKATWWSSTCCDTMQLIFPVSFTSLQVSHTHPHWTIFGFNFCTNLSLHYASPAAHLPETIPGSFALTR